MSIYKVKDLSFRYTQEQKPILSHITFDIKEGDFCLICGKSGSGKTTLLQLLKKEMMPSGYVDGCIHVNHIDHQTEIGYLFQNPDFQIVTHKVIHELSFGLENMEMSLSSMKRRIAEVVHFFNLQNILHKDISELSGGQKQLVNLASIIAMKPKVMLLDEPTAQLDPIASQEFITMLKRINEELHITIVMVEHDLEQTVPLCDQMLYLENGQLVYNGSPTHIPYLPTFEKALPVSAQLFHKGHCQDISYDFKTVRKWIEENVHHFVTKKKQVPKHQDLCLSMQNIHFHYQDLEVLKGLSLNIYKHEILAIVGSNGSGKSTLLKVMCGLLKKERGKIIIDGQDMKNIKNPFNDYLGYLPQDPTTLFLKETVKEEINTQEGMKFLQDLQLEDILDQHPYDLSGGQMQLVALVKVLERRPQILLLDELTKGLDAYYKESIGKLLKKLSQDMTIVIVSHDLEFCAQYADRVGMMFEGNIDSLDDTSLFFSTNLFYTTIMSKLTKGLLENVNVIEDLDYE